MLKYYEDSNGSKLKLKNDRYLYTFRKKDLPNEAQIVGSVELRDLKKELEIYEEKEKEIYEKDNGENILEFYNIKYLVEENGKGKVKGYIPVKDLSNDYVCDELYIEVRSGSILPWWLLMSTSGLITTLVLIGVILIAGTVLAYSIISQPDEGTIKIRDTVPYDDTPVEISTPEDTPTEVEDGEVSMNLYSYHEVGEGDILKLTNLSTNDVNLQYTIYAENGDVIYESDLVEPGKADPWIPSEYLQKGTNKVKFQMTPYTLDTNEECIGYTSDVTIVVK